jgi:hypothetical protein
MIKVMMLLQLEADFMEAEYGVGYVEVVQSN